MIRHNLFRFSTLLFAVVSVCTFWAVSSIDIISVHPSSVYAGVPTQVQMQVDLAAFSIPHISNVAIGAYHTCACTTSGAVYCWGRGDYGQVGNGRNNAVNSMPTLVLFSGVVSVCAGGHFSCALTVNSSVLCFGRNDYGQLGDGTFTNRFTPVSVAGLHSSVVAIACGDYHACALNTSGALLCWGRNGNGQLGDGSVTSKASPTHVPNLPPITAIGLGSLHSCALGAAPSSILYCWGHNTLGSLGNGGSVDVNVPTQVIGMGHVQVFALGKLTTCAANSSGLYCWGWNKAGQVGDGTLSNRALPTAVQHSPGMGLVRALSLGDLHACAIDTTNLMWCWGWTSHIGLDSDSIALRSLSFADQPAHAVANVSLPSKSKSLACGDKNTCVVSVNGSLLCWGANSNGQVGDGTTLDTLLPTSVFESCSNPAVALSRSGLTCSWSNSSIILKISSTSLLPATGAQRISFFLGPFQFTSLYAYSQVTVLAPVALTSVTPSIVFTSSSSAVVLTISGQGFGPAGGAVTMGRIGSFTVGLNFSVVSDTVVTVRVDVGSAISVASAAALDVEFYSNGVLFRSESSSSRLLVKSSLVIVTPRYVYTKVEGKLIVSVSGEGFGVQSSSMGQYHSCVVMIGGSLLCWGDPAYGKLGTSTITRSPSLPVSGFADPVVFVSAGTQHTCVITAARDALCMGSNEFGKLGTRASSSSKPVLVQGGHKWLHLSASHFCTCGVSIKGAVYCWGRDRYGQGGSGAVVNAERPIPNAVVTLNSGFQSVVCAQFTCCALRTNGQLWCWGNGYFGELGQGNTESSGIPVRLMLPSGVESNFTSVSGGFYTFCAISTSFQVWCWGDNSNSACGLPSAVALTFRSPILVPNTPAFASHIVTGGKHACAGNASVLVCWGSNAEGQIGDGSRQDAHHPPSVVALPLASSETIVSVSSNRGWSVGVVTSFNRLFVWGFNNEHQIGDGLKINRGSPFSNVFPVSSLRIGLSSEFDAMTWIGRSTFAVHLNSNSFLSPSNGSLGCSFSLGHFEFMSWNASSQVTVLAPVALTSVTPSIVFTSSSSAVVLTISGQGFGPAGGAVTMGRIGSFTVGLNFSVVSDTVVTVRVDVGSAISVASAAALDVEFYSNGVLFRSSSPDSRLSVSDPLDRFYPPELYAHNLQGGVFLTIFGNQFGPVGGIVSEGRIGMVSKDLMFTIAVLNSSTAFANFQFSAHVKSSGLPRSFDSSVVLVAISPFSSVVEQLIGRSLSVEFVVNSKRFRSSPSSSSFISVAIQVLNVHPSSIFASRAAVLTLQVDNLSQLKNNISHCSEVMIGSVVLSLPCLWISNSTVRVSVSSSDVLLYNAVHQNVQFWDGTRLFKSTEKSRVLVLPYQEDAVPPLAEVLAPSDLSTYLLSFGISLGVIFVVIFIVYTRQRRERLLFLEKLARQIDSSYNGQVTSIEPSQLVFADQTVTRHGFFGNIRKALWKVAPGVNIAVAVKQCNFTQCQKWDRNRFEETIQRLAALRHPNCIQVLGYCTQAENLFVVMEWIQNGSIADAIASGTAVPPHARLRMARELAQGLAFLHSNGVIHGSIKNRNIMMGQDGAAKLGEHTFTKMQRYCSIQPSSFDATEVRIVHDSNLHDELCDVLAVEALVFLSPDVLGMKHHLSYHDIITGSFVPVKFDSSPIHALAADSASSDVSASQDVFAFGIVMWSLLAWKKPLDGMDEQSVKEFISRGADLPSVSPLPKGITSDYVDVMNSCLNKDPLLRPTAKLLSDRLAAIDPSSRPVQPIDLVPPGFVSVKTTLLDCILVAMPKERDKLERMIENISHFHSTDAEAIRVIRECNLSLLEAQSISFYTFSTNNGFDWQDSPFYIYNKAVRMLDYESIAAWQDFSYYFISGLKKIPSVKKDVFRGLDLRLTQISHLYQKDGLVNTLFFL
jgi:alpha-tubulin suppressor-like RCC1 family protein/serine/threonine protein kinase